MPTLIHLQAAGGIVSTAGDLEKFMKALASGKLGLRISHEYVNLG